MKLLKFKYEAQFVWQKLLVKKKFVNTNCEENEELAKKIHDAVYDKCYAIAKAGPAKDERTASFY